MIAISGTLDPDEVLGRLLAAAVRILPGVAGLILRPAADHRAVVAAAHGDPAASLLGHRLDLAGDAPLTRLLEAEAPVLGGLGTDRSAELGALLRAAGAWIGVPLQARGERVGVLLVTTSLGDRFGDSQVNIGAALAGQAMVAYDNARLFARAESSLAELRHAHKLEAVGRLAAGIAHEIDTPIQCISDNTRFLVDSFAGLSRVLDAYRAALRAEDVTVADGRLDELARLEAEVGLDLLAGEAPAAATRTLDGAAHIARIVLAMKTLGHPDDDELTEADLNQALETTVTVARGELEDVAEVELDLAPLPPVSCYLSDLHQVFLNLLVNAAHAVAQTGRRGTIRVATRLRDDQVVVEIGDDGAGIPDAVQPVGQGTGRALSLAHAIVVDRHGGSVTVDSRNGQGTTFIIRLHLHGPTREPAGRLPR
jgi:signal transduction histidine kinase